MIRTIMKRIEISERKYHIELIGIKDDSGKATGEFYLNVSDGNPNIFKGDHKIGMSDAKTVFTETNHEKLVSLVEFLVI